MIYYVTHSFEGDINEIKKAKKILHDLQINDMVNCYICPLFALAHIGYNEVKAEDEMELRLDLLTCADKLILASDISNEMQKEIDFAKLVKMEVMQIEESGELQPFTE